MKKMKITMMAAMKTAQVRNTQIFTEFRAFQGKGFWPLTWFKAGWDYLASVGVISV